MLVERARAQHALADRPPAAIRAGRSGADAERRAADSQADRDRRAHGAVRGAAGAAGAAAQPESPAGAPRRTFSAPPACARVTIALRGGSAVANGRAGAKPRCSMLADRSRARLVLWAPLCRPFVWGGNVVDRGGVAGRSASPRRRPQPLAERLTECLGDPLQGPTQSSAKAQTTPCHQPASAAAAKWSSPAGASPDCTGPLPLWTAGPLDHSTDGPDYGRGQMAYIVRMCIYVSPGQNKKTAAGRQLVGARRTGLATQCRGQTVKHWGQTVTRDDGAAHGIGATRNSLGWVKRMGLRLEIAGVFGGNHRRWGRCLEWCPEVWCQRHRLTCGRGRRGRLGV